MAQFEFGTDNRESSAVAAVPHAATQMDDKAPRRLRTGGAQFLLTAL